jgi:TP901 family phage tail tape measure protein
MEIKLVGTANLSQMKAQFAQVNAELTEFNQQLRATTMHAAGGNRQGFMQMQGQMGAMSRAFDSAIASSGKFRVEQVRLHDIVGKNTDLLRKQQLTMGQVFGKGSKNMMQQVYREQLAMQQMMVRGVKGGITPAGGLKASLLIPSEVHKSWDTLTNKVGMFRYQLASASRGLLNWGKNTQWAGRQLTAGLTYPMLAVGAAAGVMAYKVDKEFTRIRKVYNTTANQNSSSMEEQKRAQLELDQVREQGMKTGMAAARAYGSSITDTLGVQAELAATGQKGAALQAATTAVMKSAMLGEIDYQTATKATIALQQQLHASSSDLADMWAYMNSVENQTSLQMKDFAEAIPIALGPIRTMGGDLKDLGTLMTGMVSQGIQVGKAANAIKALPQRLSRPSAQVQKEFAAMTGQDILQINSEHGDNIIDLLTAIYHATEPLEQQARKKVFAGLFGSFQLSTMQAMVESMGDLEKGTNQVTTAQQIGMQSAKDWQQVSDQEVKAFQKSASGRFKIAIETIKASLSTMGQPFLEMATHVVSGITKMIDLFNKLPKIVKKGAMGLLIFGAIVGPLIMVVGLFANLVGNMGLMAAAALKLVSRFNILNKEEEANAMINRLAEKGLTNRATQTALLTERVTALTQALAAQNEVAMMGGVSGAGAAAGATARASQPSFLGMPGGSSPTLSPQTYSSTMYHGARISQTESASELASRQRSADNMAAAERERLRTQLAINQKAATETKIREKSQSAIKGSGVAMGAMGVAMAASLATDNELVTSMSRWVMLLAIGVPAAKGLGVALAVGGRAASEAAASASRVVTANLAAAGGAAKIVGPMRAAGVAGRGLLAGMNAMMGPIGWIVTALASIGYLAYKWNKHEEAITKEKEAQARAIYDQNNLLQDQLKIEDRKRKRISTPSIGLEVKGLPDASELADTMSGNDAYKDIISVMKNGTEYEKQAAVVQKYKDVLESTGGSAKKAQLYIEALFRASGQGAIMATSEAEKWGEVLGNSVDTSELGFLFAKRLLASLNDDEKSIKEAGASIGKDLSDAIGDGTNANANSILDNFSTQLSSTWAETWKNQIDPETKKFLEQIGVQNADQFKVLANAYTDFKNNVIDGSEFDKITGIDSTDANQLGALTNAFNSLNASGVDYQKTLNGINTAESAVAQQLAGDLGISEDRIKNITTLTQLRATWEWKLQTATKENTMQLYRQQVAWLGNVKSLGGMLPFMKDVSDEQKLQIARQLLAARGLKDTKNLDEAIALLTGDISNNMASTAANTNAAVGAAGRLAGAFNLADEDVKNIYKSGMEGVENSMADSASNAFDTRMNASIEAAQGGWDSKIKALQDKQEREQDKFDSRWDRRKDHLDAYYDHQKDNIDKAIKAEENAEEIRQKIFDAEKKRIDRMADAANRNIDFNIALRTGDLDAAAKIQNDAIATAQTNAIDDASAAGAGSSDAKVEKLNQQKDLLDTQQQAAEDALAKREDIERKHLEKMQQMQADSLQAQADASMKAYNLDWDRKKASFEDQLTLFKSYIARNQDDLDAWMTQVGLSYDDFGIGVKSKGDQWSKYFNETLTTEIHKAGVSVASDNMWTEWGATEVKKMLLGMGFGNMGKFKRFIMSGILPDDFGQVKPKPPKTPSGPGSTTGPHSGGAQDSVGTFHTGGMIGRDKGGRTGVARNTKGLHPTEILINAQKGEYLINKKVAAKNPEVLDYINRHGEPPPINTREYSHARLEGLGAGPAPGMAGIMGSMARGVMSSLVGAFGHAAKASVASAANARASSGSAGVTPYAGTIGAPNKIGQQAISWAVDQIGAEGWYRLCQKFVRTALGSGGGFSTAEDAWYGAKYRHSISDPSKVPPGVPVYWTDGGAGHTALSTGGGNVVSTDYPNSGYVGTGTIAGITSQWGKHLAGWTEDINGKRIWSAPSVVPGLSGGGVTTHDTPAIVHQGEMVIDPGRTKKLYGLVDSFSETSKLWPWLFGLYKMGPDGMPDPSNFNAAIDKLSAGTSNAASTKSGNLKNGTYNVKFSSSNADTQDDLAKLFNMADVLSLTEFTKAKQALIPWMNQQGWGVAGAGDGAENVVAYKKSMFNASNTGSQVLNKTLGESLSGAIGKGGARSLKAAYTMLSGNGMKFWQVAAHTIAHLWKNPTLNRKVQQEQFGSLGSLATRLGNGGKMPVFVGGDMNNDPRSIAGSRPGGAQGMGFFNPLTNAGLSTNWDPAQMMANPGGSMDGRYIDHIFSNSLAKLISTKTVGGMHSDHKAVISEFSLPQLSKGGLIKWDNTIANLHADERVLTADNTRHLDRGLENLASGAGNTYNSYITVNGADMDVHELANEVVKIQQRQEARKPQRMGNR